MVFNRLYQDIFLTKYAHSFIDTNFYFNSTNVLIGNTVGAKGGGSWKELWIGKESPKNRIAICHSYLKGWESDGEVRYTLDFGLISDRIYIKIVEHYLKLNSMNTWDTTRSIIVLNEFVDLSTVLNEECR